MAILTAQAWSQRPSQLLQITDPRLALALDDALALRLNLERQQANDVSAWQSKAKGEAPPGMVHESAQDALRAELAARAAA